MSTVIQHINTVGLLHGTSAVTVGQCGTAVVYQLSSFACSQYSTGHVIVVVVLAASNQYFSSILSPSDTTKLSSRANPRYSYNDDNDNDDTSKVLLCSSCSVITASFTKAE